MRWTGHGWLVPVLFVLTFFGGSVLVASIAPAGFPVGLSVAIAMLVGAVVHGWVGRSLNSEGTPDGRVWHNEHQFFGAPFQRGVGLYLLVALIAVAVVVGQRTSPALGWVIFAGAPVAILIGYLRYQSRRRVSSVGDREELAQRRGWWYKNADPLLPRRWKEIYGRRNVDAMAPFGIIGGELQGFSFTIFDSEVSREATASSPKRRLRRTTWAVHLPVAYPRLVVKGVSREWLDKMRGEASSDQSGVPSGRDLFDVFFGDTPEGEVSPEEAKKFVFPQIRVVPGELMDGEELYPQTEVEGFGAALLIPEVRQTTVTHRLVGWEIAGRDLVFRSAERDTSLPADELVRVVEQLVELARRFPPGLAERYGTQPTTDIPR